MSSTSELPRCVAFRWDQNGSYLRYVHKSDGSTFLEPSGQDCISPYTRFYVEPSKQHDGLVHIRCCYNNKYWVAVQQQEQQGGDVGGGGWIIGTVDEPEDDLSKPSCTLFKLDAVTGNQPQSVRLLHAQLGKHASMFLSSEEANNQVANYLHVRHEETGEDHNLNAYTLLDLSEEKQLPKYLAIKGDNGKYLKAKIKEGYNYLKFSADDIGDPLVVNTTFTNSDGTVRIKNNHFDKFWRRSPNWIWADSTDTSNTNRDTLFKVIKIGDYFALQNLGNNYFCKRLTTEGKTSCLNAGIPAITAEAKLMLEEAIISRKIHNVDFDLSKSRIYGNEVLNMSTATAINHTTVDNTAKLILEYTETNQRKWDSTVSWKLSVNAGVKAGIPVIAQAKVSIKNEFSGEYKWGSTLKETTKQQIEYEVTVPPKTKVTVSLIASKASCDVPFSYKQEDALYDGRVVTYDMDDGIYNGINCYDFKYETKEEKIFE
ncbi:hypothetical protein GUJ93_ZPchr0011g27508 [Zizania palustris]|uniref:Agglutinin domain-containing protein n=1 Tax=Zizania palustris TaxID=103762 RepID=A0A8J5WKN3_ZIZPA|nr:hypothetical protein GUJ93_ZPchr0011g27508 [Zizania palustris]